MSLYLGFTFFSALSKYSFVEYPKFSVITHLNLSLDIKPASYFLNVSHKIFFFFCSDVFLIFFNFLIILLKTRLIFEKLVDALLTI